MSNSKKVIEAMEAVFVEIEVLMEEEDKKLKNAIINNHEHVGLAIWYATNPEEASLYVEQVLKEHKDKVIKY